MIANSKKALVLLAFSATVVGPSFGCGTAAKEVGEPCKAAADCSSSKCYTGICLAASPFENDASCKSNAECKSLVCTAGVCAAGTAELDAGCLNNEECATQVCEDAVCAPKPDGAACTSNDECEGGTCYSQLCTSKKGDAVACAADADCASGICASKKCAVSCTKASDCKSTQDCTSDDGKRLFCFTKTYNKDVGKACGASGSCPTTATKCVGYTYDALALCSAECKSDLNCPPTLMCNKQSDGKSYCLARPFCAPCLYDGQCGTDAKCVSMTGGKFCTKTCTKGSTECPMYAECKAGSSGTYYCQHKSGKCVGDGSLCAPCVSAAQCKTGGVCLTFGGTEESFCGTDCTSTGTCESSSSKCYQISTTQSQCGPAAASSGEFATCTSGLTYIMNVGDVMDDFAMVGYNDLKGDGDTTTAKLGIVKLSDLSSKKIIILNIGAFW
jgi:hypothetical protein